MAKDHKGRRAIPGKILLIDDDAELCAELADLLRAEGFKVKIASDAFEGVKLLASGRFDAAVLDYKMPGLDGVEILKKAKDSKVKTAVFLVSGRPFMEELLAVEDLSGYVRSVVQKPFDPEYLLAKIKETRTYA
ncbi:MAG: response regulator [Elusimicrobiales bacterium]|jgi:DNA-binding response OmpR family regulator